MKSIFAIIVVFTLLLSGASCARAQESSPLLGKAFPDFTLERSEGASVSLSQLIKDKKAIVYFFATWCPHCREQINVITAKKALFKEQGITVVLVNIGETRAKVKKFRTEHGLDNDILLDQNSFVAETYQVMGVPMLVFIGTDGKVRYVEYGLPDNYAEILK